MGLANSLSIKLLFASAVALGNKTAFPTEAKMEDKKKPEVF